MRHRGNLEYESVDISTVAERLEKFLATVLDEPFGLSEVARLSGGASLEQYTFTLQRGEAGEAGPERMVLRLNPPALLNETDRLREFQIMRAVEDDLPVLHAYWVADEDSAFGVPALITGFNPGVAAPTDIEGKATGLATVYGGGRSLLSSWRTWPGCTPSTGRRRTSRPRRPHRRRHRRRRLARGAVRPGVGGGHLRGAPDDGAHPGVALGPPACGRPGVPRARRLSQRQLPVRQIRRPDNGQERLRYYGVLNMYWAVTALYATAPRLAAEKVTHVDVMMNFVTGLAAFFLAELNKILEDG